jgi:tRNA (adenine57-N1/adenine58-N1)-methyltransferase catalytic subunit
MTTSDWSGVRTGPLRPGERVRLTDPKGRRRSLVLEAGATYFTHRGAIGHDLLIGCPDGTVVTSSGGVEYLVQRPLLADSVVAMPRGAAVIYPKDAAQIVTMADIFPGARVVEAGAGSGALSCFLLRAIGTDGCLVSYERRADFADVARRNVREFFGGDHPAWDLRVGDVAGYEAAADAAPVDRIVLDLLAPWELVPLATDVLAPGGILCGFVATTTQLSRLVETVRAGEAFTEPEAWETLLRRWHVEGLAVRPDHTMSGHTGFLMTARRLAPGTRTPRRTRRPSPGAYGPDYAGPRAPGLDGESAGSGPGNDAVTE